MEDNDCTPNEGWDWERRGVWFATTISINKI